MFEIKDRAAMGRIGRLTTPHGAVVTPTLLPVINPNRNRVTPKRMKELFGAEIVITNAYIIRQNPELRARAEREGVHRLLDWEGPVMTDSGTFQSYVYGDVEVKPEEVVAFQRAIGSDVGTILDVFTVPETPHAEAAAQLETTLARARAAAATKDGMLLAATVQGGLHADLRERAAREVALLDADVLPIGGVVPLMEQGRYADLARVILAAKRGLPSGRPVHLFGAGHPLVFPLAAALGCDLFDSASYAKYAEDGRMIFAWGTRSLEDLEELPCTCPACARWKDARELAAAPRGDRDEALMHHNLSVSFAEIRRVRQAIRDGNLWELVEERAAQNPALADAMAALAEPAAQELAERFEPLSSTRAFLWRGDSSLARPVVRRLHERILERWAPSGGPCMVLSERPKPYAESCGPYLRGLVQGDAVVESPFGPIPLEFEGMWPVAQSVFPRSIGTGGAQVRAAYAERFWKKFDGCDVLPFDAKEIETEMDGPSMPTRDLFDRRRIAAVARFQFGVEGGSALTEGALTFRRSPNNCLVRNVFADGVHVASLRARDGFLSLTVEGGERLRRATKAPDLRLQIENEAAPFVAEGKNPMVAGVRGAGAALRPGDEALIVDETDALVAVGRMQLSGWEVPMVKRGAAARTRHRVDSEAE